VTGRGLVPGHFLGGLRGWKGRSSLDLRPMAAKGNAVAENSRWEWTVRLRTVRLPTYAIRPICNEITRIAGATSRLTYWNLAACTAPQKSAWPSRTLKACLLARAARVRYLRSKWSRARYNFSRIRLIEQLVAGLAKRLRISGYAKVCCRAKF
jgi:hypothetical protein